MGLLTASVVFPMLLMVVLMVGIVMKVDTGMIIGIMVMDTMINIVLL